MISLVLPLILAQSSPNAVDKALDELLAKKTIPGAVVLVREGGKTVYERAAGYANLETMTPMSMDSIHELASVSKQFTAATIMLLVEDGKLKLSDPITKFFEGAPEAWSKVTVEHLLQHTGGLPDYLGEDFDPADNRTVMDYIKGLYDKPLEFEPGSQFAYSNTGYAVLGLIVDHVSMDKFHGTLRKRVFAETGMKSAVITNPNLIVPNRAYGYSKLLNQFVNEPYCAPNVSAPGDGMVSASARDLVSWHETMVAGKLLIRDSWKFLWTPSKVTSVDESPFAYGGGFIIDRKGDKPRVSHSGGWIGTMTYLMSDIENDHCLIVLVNTDSGGLAEILQAVEEGFPKIFPKTPR